MYLTEFDTKFDIYVRKDEQLLFIPPYNTPFDYISMSTEECKIKRKTSWLNLKVCRDEIHLENIKSRYKKAIDFDFESHVYFYEFIERYDFRWNKKIKFCIRIPDALQSLAINESQFYCLLVEDEEVNSKMSKHILGTNGQRLVSITQNQMFQTLSMEERKNLLALFLSRKVDNFDLALNILNIYS